MSKNILVVEDEFEIVELVDELLSEEGYIVDSAEDGVEGLRKFQENDYDLIICDVMMDRMDGYKLVEKIRHTSNIPILMLTALSEEYDEVKAFKLGVNDFVMKPFSMSVLLLRVKALLYNNALDGITIDEELEINSTAFTVTYKDELVEVTVKEFEVLKYLVTNPDRVFSREQIIDAVWGYDFQGDFRNIDTHVKNIRRKIPNDKIKTIKGLGYKYEN